MDVYRAIRPAFVLSHSTQDIYNHDHPAVTDFAQHARIVAMVHGSVGWNALTPAPVLVQAMRT